MSIGANFFPSLVPLVHLGGLWVTFIFIFFGVNTPEKSGDSPSLFHFLDLPHTPSSLSSHRPSLHLRHFSLPPALFCSVTSPTRHRAPSYLAGAFLKVGVVCVELSFHLPCLPWCFASPPPTTVKFGDSLPCYIIRLVISLILIY